MRLHITKISTSKKLYYRVVYQPKFSSKQHLIYSKDENFSLTLQEENDEVFLLHNTFLSKTMKSFFQNCIIYV